MLIYNFNCWKVVNCWLKLSIDVRNIFTCVIKFGTISWKQINNVYERDILLVSRKLLKKMFKQSIVGWAWLWSADSRSLAVWSCRNTQEGPKYRNFSQLTIHSDLDTLSHATVSRNYSCRTDNCCSPQVPSDRTLLTVPPDTRTCSNLVSVYNCFLRHTSGFAFISD